MLGTNQPVSKNGKESFWADFGGYIEIFREGADGAFIDFEEQSVFAAEVLEYGTLGDTQGGGDVTDAGIVISMLGEMLCGGFNDSRALGFRTRADLGLALVERRRDAIAGDSRHNNDF